jgi:hypothetical protein
LIEITVDQKSLNAMRERLGAFGGHLKRHLATAVNRVGKSVRVEAAQRLGPLINLKLHSSNKGFSKPISKAKTLKKTMKQKNKATPENARITIGLWEGYPFPLKYHEAKNFVRKRRGKKLYEGVQYKEQMGGIFKTIHDAFLVPRFAGHVFKRANEARGPLTRMNGHKPGDFFREGNIGEVAAAKAKERLPIEINRRLREITLAASGKIKLRASKDMGAN